MRDKNEEGERKNEITSLGGGIDAAPISFSTALMLLRKTGSFPFVPPPPPVRYAPLVTEHVSLHSKSLCKNMARASGGANNMRPLSFGGGVGWGGGTNGKDPKNVLNRTPHFVKS